METIEQRLGKIEERNVKVEGDKAWETSWTRRLLLALFTYLAIWTYLWAIDVRQAWLSAVVPAIGFMLSTLTMPWFKKMWLGNKEKTKDKKI